MKKIIKTLLVGVLFANFPQVFADEISQRFEGCYSGVCLFKDGEYLQGFAEIGNESLWMAGKYDVKNNKIYLESFARNEPFEVYAGYNPNLNGKIEFIYQQYTDTKAKSLLAIKGQSPIALIDKYGKCTIEDNCKKEKITATQSDSFQLIKQSPTDNQAIIQTYQIPSDKNTFLVISYGYQNSTKIKEYASFKNNQNAWYFQPCLKEENHRLYTAKEMDVRWGQVLASKAVIDELLIKGHTLWVNEVGSWQEMSYFDLEDYSYDKQHNRYIAKSYLESGDQSKGNNINQNQWTQHQLQDNKFYKPELENFDNVRTYQKLFYNHISPTEIPEKFVLDGEITRDMCFVT